ncbi:two-component response regulator [Klebsiella pneumoniae]|nr:two-component response regulator [Klebsiella pneumoniae]
MQTPHILIVEDELVTRNTLKSIFEAEGYDVFEATDGAEMHQILSENDINLVIMDINLRVKMVFCWRASCASRLTSR